MLLQTTQLSSTDSLLRAPAPPPPPSPPSLRHFATDIRSRGDGGNEDGGGKGWFDKGSAMVVEKGRVSKGWGIGGGGGGWWWSGGVGKITTTRAREPERAERPLSSDVFVLFLFFVFCVWFDLFVSVYVSVYVLCFCIYLLVHCT